MHPIVIHLKNYTLRIVSIKHLLISLGGLTLFILLVLALIYFGQYSKPIGLTVSNISDSHASISFLTDDKVSAAIVLSKDKNFKGLPLSGRIKDIGDAKRIIENHYKSHYFSLDSLQPNTTYYFRVYEGFRNAYEGEFKTGAVTENLNRPNIVYGTVFNKDGIPTPGVLIYLRTNNKSKYSSILSTITNSQGKWSIDLGNLRTENLKSIEIVDKDTIEEMIIDASDYGRFKASTNVEKDQPWPDIILK